MKYIIILASIIISIYFFIKAKKLTALIFMICSMVFLGVTITNSITSTNKIVLSNEILTNISKIDWNSEMQLLSLGFEKDGDEYTYLLESPSIRVSKATTTPKNTVKFNNISYFAEEISLGKLSIKRIFSNELAVMRRITIYYEERVISIIEDNTEGSEYEFEKIINRFVKKTEK